MVTALPEAAGVLDPGEVPVRVEARHRRPGGRGGGDMGKRESLGKEGAQRDKGCASCPGAGTGVLTGSRSVPALPVASARGAVT